MDRYRPHERLVAPAQPTAAPGWLVAGVGLILLVFMVLNLIYLWVLQALPDWPMLRHELSDGTTPRALWLILLGFLPLLAALALVLRVLHRRPLFGLLGPPGPALRDFWRVTRALALLFVILALLPYPDALAPQQRISLGDWAGLIPLSLALILLQVATEELLFRGYLQSQLAARFRPPVIWMLVPALLFGLLHFDPATYGSNAVWLAGWAVVFGLAAADLTARSGTLGPALALHFVNNVSALMWSSMQGHWDGLALFALPFGPGNTAMLAGLLPVEGLMLLCGWLTARIALRR